MTVTSPVRFARVRLASGPHLHYAESGDHNGVPIVLLHGWPDSWFSFSRVLPLLPPRLRVLVPDQRGFGESDRPASQYSIPEFAADVIAFLDALGIERTTIVGHSYGSFVARQAVIAHPDRFDALVLIGTGFVASNPVITELLPTVRELRDPVPAEFAREFQAGTVYRQVPDEFFERIIVESLKLPARLWRLDIERLVEYHDAGEVGRIRIPTLLLWGARDALFPRAHQDDLVAALPNARLKVYEETGHCPNWERPEQVADDITRFHEETAATTR